MSDWLGLAVIDAIALCGGMAMVLYVRSVFACLHQARATVAAPMTMPMEGRRGFGDLDACLSLRAWQLRVSLRLLNLVAWLITSVLVVIALRLPRTESQLWWLHVAVWLCAALLLRLFATQIVRLYQRRYRQLCLHLRACQRPVAEFSSMRLACGAGKARPKEPSGGRFAQHVAATWDK